MKSPLEEYCICTSCGKRYTDGYHKTCDFCRERKRIAGKKTREKNPDYSVKRYWDHKAKGLCTNCSRPAVHGRLCAVHYAKALKRYDSLKNHYREQGLCIWCGAERLEGKMFCPVCYEKNMVNQRKATAAVTGKRRRRKHDNTDGGTG